jgi:phosphonate transport system substrate-binding protein
MAGTPRAANSGERRPGARRLKAVIAAGFFWLASLPAGAQTAPETITLGIVPYLSPRAMLEVYSPLRLRLEQRLERPVAIATEPDYRGFIHATERRAYTILLTGSHMGRLAEKENGYRPILRTSQFLVALFIAAADDPATDLESLRGKTVVLPDPLAQVTLMARLFLRTRGLIPGQDVILASARTHNSAALSVINHDAAAAAVSSWAFQQMPADQVSRVRVIGSSETMAGPLPGRAPALMYLTAPGIGEHFSQQIQAEIMTYLNDTEDGRRSMGATDRDGVRPLTQEELAALDPFLPELHLVLNGN